MMHFKSNTRSASLRRGTLPALLCALLLLGATGCITKDDTLGSNLIPEDQQMRAGYTVLQSGALNPKKYVETRLFQTDSVVTSNLTTGYFGTSHNDTIGLRSAGFLTQFTNYYLVDEGYFGFKPICDSVRIFLSITAYGRDTLTEQTFEVYEVVDNAYITEKPASEGSETRDSIYHANFDPERVDYLNGRSVVSGNKLFTFRLGTENGGYGPSATAVTMDPTPEGREFIEKLMLQKGEHAGDYSIYATEDENLAEWCNIFKGLYIKPAAGDETLVSGSSETKGTIYATDLSASGFMVYGRNHVESDPTLIQDTIGMAYYFYNADLEYGNLSINTIRHNYDGSRIDIGKARAYNEDGTLNTNRTQTSEIYVEGLGGVVTELSFTQEFFDHLQEVIDAENAATGKNFRTFAFTRVLMEVYFPGGQYDWEQIQSGAESTETMIGLMNNAPSRLGMYTNYWRKSYIPDYNYTYESYYGTTLPYGGYINRSHGCYRMDITTHVQQVWNAYTEAKAASADGTVDLSTLAQCKVYIGPEATDLFTNNYTVLQGESDAGSDTAAPGGETEPAPIRFTVAYSLIR